MMTAPNDTYIATMTAKDDDYTTTYIKLHQMRYPTSHYHRGGGDTFQHNSSLQMLFAPASAAAQTNAATQQRGRYNSHRRRLGVQLIQQRWKIGGCKIKNGDEISVANNEECPYDENSEDENSAVGNPHDVQRQERKRQRSDSPNNNSSLANFDVNNNRNASSASVMEPTLLFRRMNTNLNYSNARYYKDVQFLNSGQSVVIGVDNYGDLDIVRVPSSLLGGGGGYYLNNDNGASNDEDESGGGIGKMQADRLSVFSGNKANSGGGPRQPMNDFHYEIFGYDNGSKFAVGLQSGQVQLFTTERAAAGSCLFSNDSSATSLGSTHALWSCLPPTSTTIGPQRRYYKSDKYPLHSMLSSSTNKTKLFDAYNTSFFEEMPDWDKHHALMTTCCHVYGNECPWAFRECGTALMGACVDVENGDCFSLRVIDERCCLEPQAAANVVVVDERNAACNRLDYGERVDSVCFSGEYGLVTSHSVSRNGADSELTASCIKWWDHRMLRSHQSVNSMCLSFPRDNVSLLCPDVERCLGGSFGGKRNHSHSLETPSSLRELSADQPFDRTDFGLLHVKRLVGARDSSDRFAIHLQNSSQSNPNHRHDEVLMVDSCRGEITQQIQHASFGGRSPSISSYLDTMACFTTEEDEVQYISIYDVSRHRNDTGGGHDPHLKLSGKKRLFRDDDCVRSVEANNEGLLQRLSPKVHDIYGIDSSVTCLAIDEYGAMIACGTSDGDMFVLNSLDLGGLAV